MRLFASFPRFADYLECFLDDIEPDCPADDEVNETESCKQNSQTGKNDCQVRYHVRSREDPGGAKMHALIAVSAQKI